MSSSTQESCLYLRELLADIRRLNEKIHGPHRKPRYPIESGKDHRTRIAQEAAARAVVHIARKHGLSTSARDDRAEIEERLQHARMRLAFLAESTHNAKRPKTRRHPRPKHREIPCPQKPIALTGSTRSERVESSPS